MGTVFVWNSYGEANVYPGDTKEDVLAVVNEMNKVNEVTGDTIYNLTEISQKIDNLGVEKIRNSLNSIINRIAQQSDDDRFDYGSGFVIVKKFGE